LMTLLDCPRLPVNIWSTLGPAGMANMG